MANSSIAATKPLAESSAQDSAILMLQQGQCPVISPASSSVLTFEVGHCAKEGAFYVRVSDNTGGGFFSNEWISLADIEATIEEQPDDLPFKATVFRKLYVSRGLNNYGFLAAVLRHLGILKPVDRAPYSHRPGEMKGFIAAMEDLLATRAMKVSSKKPATRRPRKKATH